MAMVCFSPEPDGRPTAKIAVPDEVAARLLKAGGLHQLAEGLPLYYIVGSWNPKLVADLLRGIVSLRTGEVAPEKERAKVEVRTLILLSIAAGRPVGGVSQKEFDDFQYAYINEMSLQRKTIPRGFVDLIIQGRAFSFADNQNTTDEQIRHALNQHGTKVSLLEPK